MKKAYQKPAIFVEQFGFSQSIARSCGIDPATSSIGKPTYASPDGCGFNVGSGIIVWKTSDICNDIESGNDIAGVGCYNAPSGATSLFAS